MFDEAYLTPLRLLCVVVVTMSAKSKGEGITPPATKPDMWAMSAIVECWFIS